MKKIISVAILLSGCTDLAVGVSRESLTICTYECPICLPGSQCGPCQEVCNSCPADGVPVELPGTAPVGEWTGSWTKAKGSGTEPHSMTVATSLILVPGGAAGADEIVWRKMTSPMTIIKDVVVEHGSCWHEAADEFDCRTGIDICATTCNGDPCVTAHATWVSLTSGATQSWNFEGK